MGFDRVNLRNTIMAISADNNIERKVFSNNPSRSRVCSVNYEYVKPDDGLWGSPFPNGSWYGMLGMLQRNEADIAQVGPFGVTLERAQVVDFSYPIFVSDHIILQKRPVIQGDISGFLKPYTVMMWIMIAFTLIFMGTLIFILRWVSASLRDNSLRSTVVSKMMDSLFWTYQQLLEQSAGWVSSSSSVGVTVSLWLLTSFIQANVYKSNLVAMLIAPKVPSPVKSVEDLGPCLKVLLYNVTFRLSTTKTLQHQWVESGAELGLC
ncbi:glutamate receptor 2-like [Oratosquilla oratoria]|uniref:glutamate receptor 2-like n=1 Tax=Oratosquilla oratoria TaxID=337810 RepID=UPI003F758702